MRSFRCFGGCTAALLMFAAATGVGAQDARPPADSLVSKRSAAAPIVLAPGTRVRLATVSGRIVCDADVKRTDADSLIVEAWRRDRQTFAWHEVQYLWRGAPRFEKRSGWTALHVAGVAVAVVGTVAIHRYAVSREGFAPLGLLPFYGTPLVVGLGLMALGELWSERSLREVTEWQRLPLAPLPSNSGVLPQHVRDVCG